MATMMARALRAAGIDTSIGAISINHQFDDHASISDYAIESVYYMANIGIIKGMGNNRFEPQETATIEQSIVIAERMYEELK